MTIQHYANCPINQGKSVNVDVQYCPDCKSELLASCRKCFKRTNIKHECKTNFEMVKEFHDFCDPGLGQATPKRPRLPRQFSAIKLITEEYQEVADAWHHGDIVHFAKELADLQYAVLRAAYIYGMDLEPIFKAVHESNMSKLGADGKPIIRKDGKILKGPNYKEPDLEPILRAQGWRG